MLKKLVKRISIIFLALLLILPLPVVSAEEPPVGLEKISADLLEKMKEVQPLPVAVWIQEPDTTAVTQQLVDTMGTHHIFDDTYYEWLREYHALRLALMSELHAQNNQAFIVEAALEGYDFIAERTEAPMIWVWLNNEDIYRLAAHEKTVRLDYMPNDGVFLPGQDNEIVYPYTSLDALRILHVVSGKATGHFTVAYDPNQDGLINTVDALLALQHATGQICISWPAGYFFLE